MQPALSERQCIPCRGEVTPLAREEAASLLQQLPGWQIGQDGNTLHRRWEFKNFKQAWAFAQQVAELAEEQKHHPDIMVGWGYAGITLTTHAAGGLHENDFILAAKINRLFQ